MIIKETLREKKYIFETKPGLFSKDNIDSGSKLLIEKMDLKPNDIVMDLGCGYGVIGLVAANLAYKGSVYMVDTDIRAIKYSRINAKLNKVDNIEIIASDGFEEIVHIPHKIIFDVVVSNPPTHLPKDTLVEFINGSKTFLKEEGKAYFVTEKRIMSFMKKEFEKVFGNFKEIAHDDHHVLFL